MNSLIGFIIENSIVNSVAALPAIGIVAYIGGSFLKNLGIGNWGRIFIYCGFGVAAGIWSYSAFDIPDRSIEFLEALSLGVGLLLLCLLVTSPTVLLKNRSKHNNQINQGQG